MLPGYTDPMTLNDAPITVPNPMVGTKESKFKDDNDLEASRVLLPNAEHVDDEISPTKPV
jgi:hypothetical protein